MSDATISRKLKQRVELYWDSRYCLSAWIIICVISPAHKCKMRGSLFYLLIVKYLSRRFCLN